MTKSDSFGAKEVEADVAVKVLFPPEGVRWMCSVGKKKLQLAGVDVRGVKSPCPDAFASSQHQNPSILEAYEPPG